MTYLSMIKPVEVDHDCQHQVSETRLYFPDREI